ncbi:MAG TPA: ABC transporter ATP-binding protein [Anaerolineaceae bacterium]
MDNKPTLIELQQIGRSFRVGNKSVQAVDGISFTINDGEILCLVGESGCGKTTTGKMIAGLLQPTSGKMLYRGQDLEKIKQQDYRSYRLAVQIVHQDPYASLNPAHTIQDILSAPLLRHNLARNREAARDRARELLQIVDLTPPDDLLDKFPHQLSGGQRQRVSVARALTVNPSFIVADEAVSMVDVSIRVSLLNMLTNLKNTLGVTFLFITHDLALAKYFAWEGRIAVMYLGRLVEIAPTPQLINHSRHPYTQALLAAIPEADPRLTRSKQRVQLRSLDIPSLLNLPSGCTFHPRCPRFEAGLCDKLSPTLVDVGNGTQVACHVVARETGAK